MLTTEQVQEVGRRIAWYARNQNQLPPGGAFVAANGGHVPNFVDEIINDVQHNRPFAQDNVRINLAPPAPPVERNLNDGYTNSPIQFERVNDTQLRLVLTVPVGMNVGACTLNINRTTGAISFNEGHRPLPEGYVLDLAYGAIGQPVVAADQRSVSLTIPVQSQDVDEDEEDNDDWDDTDYDDDDGWRRLNPQGDGPFVLTEEQERNIREDFRDTRARGPRF